MSPTSRTIGLILAILVVGAITTLPGSTAHTNERNPSTLVTLVLHQEKPQSVESFKAQLDENGFVDAFPPDGVEVVSWRGSIDLGHAITLRLPTYKVPEVREIIESREWGSIEPKLYSSYDFEPFWTDMGGELNRTQDPCEECRASAKRMLIAP